MASGPRMRCGTEATWQGRGWPTRGAGSAQGADTWQEATRVHADARVGRIVAIGVVIWRAHGLVGPGKKFGVVTQMRYCAPIFILTIFRYFICVGLCPTHVLPFAGDVDARRGQIRLGRRRSHGPESTRSSNQAHAQNIFKVRAIERRT